MLATERLLEIEQAYSAKVLRIVPHERLENYPHHKHVDQQDNKQPSYETSLQEVMTVVLNEV